MPCIYLNELANWQLEPALFRLCKMICLKRGNWYRDFYNKASR